MTPKEKTKQLIDRYINEAPITFDTSKQCALIAVDEILSLSILPDIYKKYYKEVKQEIEEL